MRAALDSSAAVQIYREFVNVFQLGYAVKDLGETTFPAFSGSLDLRYAKPLPVPSASPSAGPSAGPSVSPSRTP